ncbi:transferase family-domain-containing protein [Aspergillus ambiguus]|uniref:transferase family protein n=1 Tax=Aspergillus ambiguus TaxID=176160 RepID=UPI003CCD7F6B
MSFKTSILGTERIFPSQKPISKRTTSLSLLDAVAVDFTAPCAAWLFARPPGTDHDHFHRSDHFRTSLLITLEAYPQWCGRLKLVTVVDSCRANTDHELAPHAQRLGRVHLIYGTPQDPGVEYILAESAASSKDLCPPPRTGSSSLWDRSDISFAPFVPSTPVKKPHVDTDDGPFRPPVAIQITSLACGGFVLAVKVAHPLADTHSLTRFVKDWASVSRALCQRTSIPAIKPLFHPELLDARAAGDINRTEADPAILKQIERLPCERYDFWVDSPGCPWPPIPWSQFDSTSSSHYLLRLSHEHVEYLWQEANSGSSSGAETHRLSRHDAVLAHIWSCVNRARRLQDDRDAVHCNLTCGLRSVLQLGDDFLGTPTLMVDVDMPGETVATVAALRPLALRIRNAVRRVSDPALLAAHLHSVAFESTPQRIWQGFLGRRHIMVTTWARAGLYEVDFGWGPARYVEDVLENLDGLVVIKDAPPPTQNPWPSGSWTENGVDVVLHLRAEYMDRLCQDPVLLGQDML